MSFALPTVLVLGLLSFSLSAEARKFSFETEDIAAYFRGTGGLSSIGQKPFADATSSSTVALSSEQPQLNYGGELGFFFKMSGNLGFRIGAEIMQSAVADVKGTAPGGSAEYFSLESDIFVFNPNAAIEYSFMGDTTSRFVAYFGLGYASVRLDNAYTINAAGETALGVSSYTEKSNGSFVNGVVGLGWEGLFVDNVTAFVDVGYRFLQVNKLSYTADETVIGGSVSKGDEVTNANGQTRQFDFGGPFVGLAFRFYIDVI